MKYRKLINGQLQLSAIGLGCASYWGNRLFSARQAHRVVHHAIDAGINYFDTGHSYSGGEAERRLGHALKQQVQANSLIISSKVGTRNGQFGRLYKDFSPAWIRSSCEQSLRQLGLEQLPLFFLHGPNPEDFNDETYRVLEDLQQQGKVGSVGVNTFDDSIIKIAADSRQFTCIMLDYNILSQEREKTINSLHQKGTDVVVAGALAGGLYDRRFKQLKGLKSIWYWLRAWKNNRAQWQQAQQFDFLNHQQGVTATQLALAFVLQNQLVSSALIGTTSTQHLTELLVSNELTIEPQLLEKITKTLG